MSDVGRSCDAFWERLTARRRARLRCRSRERAALAFRLIERTGEGAALLDVGCGPGYATAYFAERGFTAVGIEASPRAAQEAREKGVEVLCLDVESDALPPGPFSVILALEVLEHLHDPLGCVERLLSRLSPDGHLVISLPNEFHLLRRCAILAGAEPFGGHDDPHVRHFGWRAAHRFVEAAGCELCGLRVASIVPPGWGAVSLAGNLCARLLPRLLAISYVMRIRRKRG